MRGLQFLDRGGFDGLFERSGVIRYRKQDEPVQPSIEVSFFSTWVLILDSCPHTRNREDPGLFRTQAEERVTMASPRLLEQNHMPTWANDYLVIFAYEAADPPSIRRSFAGVSL